MFSKVIALLLLAASAIAGPIAEGIYRITNVASHSTVRTFTAGSSIFVSSDMSNPGPFQLWDIRNADFDGYTIKNVGLGTFAGLIGPGNGALIITSRWATAFRIEPAGNGEFVIKLLFDDLLWNVEPPVIPRGNVTLRHANGSPTKRWLFTPVQDSSLTGMTGLTLQVK